MNPQVVFFLGYLGPQLEKARERENEKRKTFWCRSPKRLSKARTKKKSQNQNRLNLRSPRILIVMWLVQDWKKESESHSVMSDSLWPQGLYSPWNSPGQNTEVGSLSLLQGMGSTGKESACSVGDPGLISGLERSLEKGKATHSSILAWRIPWTV